MAFIEHLATSRSLSTGGILSNRRCLANDDALPVEWRGQLVTVMGLGRHGGGLGAVRYLTHQGARVTVSDMADSTALAASLDALAGLPSVVLKLGGHDPADFRDADVVVVNPAVHPNHPCLKVARASGVALTTEIELLLRACPATVIGVTGSNGKSTACAMLAGILRDAGRRTWLGGNFGGSLLDDLAKMTADDWVVLELSSFQLARLSPAAPLPRFVAITNCTPNHLDWHDNFDAYAGAKRRLLDGHSPGSLAVVDPEDERLAAWGTSSKRETRDVWPLDRVGPLAVPGLHNRRNAACAAALAEAAGVGEGAIRECLSRFRGLAHRLQFVAELAGRRFYNDSKSTTSDATLAALDALDGRAWLMAGGRSKGVTLEPLARGMVDRSLGAGLFGESRETLSELARSRRDDFRAHATERMAEALAWCWSQSRAGDAIVLSPGQASHDQFRDFAARGELFCRLVAELVERVAR